MKRADTIELVLKGKPDNRVLSVTPPSHSETYLDWAAAAGIAILRAEPLVVIQTPT